MPRHDILFIAPTRIGDAVLSTAILAHVLTIEPEARVTVITSNLAAPLFEGYPNLARIISIAKRSYNRHWLTLWSATISTRWHAIWDMRNSILSYTLRANKRYRYVKPSLIAPKIKQYETAFGTPNLPRPVLWPQATHNAAAAAIMPGETRYLILAPIANWTPKEWPITHYITLAKTLLDGTCAGYRPVIICAAHECQRALTLLDALAAYNPIDLTHGDIPMLTIYACMKRAHGFVGNDSGLMHMAATAGIPTLGLFGPTPHEIYQPWGEKAAYLAAPNGNLSELDVADVADTLSRLIAHNAPCAPTQALNMGYEHYPNNN